MSNSTPVILWLRQDLRLTDNPALAAAAETGRPLLPLFILDEKSPGRWAPGGASRWWLGKSLTALAAAFAKRGAPLVLRRGEAAMVLDRLIAETGADAIFWSRCYEPWAIARDKQIKARLTARGVQIRSFNAALLQEPWTIQTRSDGPFKVFAPFWRALLAKPPTVAPLPAPRKLNPFTGELPSETVEDWRLQPTGPDWSSAWPSAGSLAKPVPPGAWRVSLKRPRPITRRIATGLIAPAPPGSRLISIGARLGRAKSGRRSKSGGRQVLCPTARLRPSCGSWSGANSAIICSTTGPICQSSPGARNSPIFPGDRTGGFFEPGSKGQPVIPLSMPG